MTENMKKLLNILYENRIQKEYFSSSELSELLNLSSRQIRKYIARINEETHPPLILSSHKGYKLNLNAYRLYNALICHENVIENPKTRSIYIIQQLISSKDEYDIFDLSDKLYVSPATIENDLKSVRRLLSTFDIVLKRNHDKVWIVGSENNKRLLIQHLLSTSKYSHFILKDQLNFLSYQYCHQDISSIIRNTFLHNNIFANDYTLNNIIMHLIIMIDRIRNGYSISENVVLDEFTGTPQFDVAIEIKDYVENNFSITINEAELYNLLLIISNNTTEIHYSSVNANNICHFVEEKYIKIARETIKSVETYYCLEPFDDEFFVKFTLHLKNMFLRIEKGYTITNPLTSMTKTSYPLIYDIAVFIALDLKTNYKIQINESEISFLAFHLGSYFENNHSNKITCVFVYIDYYSLHEKIIDKIMHQYTDYLYIKSAISVHNYDPAFIHADLILSMTDLVFPCEYVILHPILQDTDYHNIDYAIKKITNTKRINLLKNSLVNFFNEKLFFHNIEFESQNAALEFMCNSVVKLGLAHEELYQSVLARESISSTAFDHVAIPHSLSRTAKHNFICIAICRNSIHWIPDFDVQLIVLIGISKEDRQLFSSVFQELVNILSNPSYVKKLIHCKTLSEFTNCLLEMVGTE